MAHKTHLSDTALPDTPLESRDKHTQGDRSRGQSPPNTRYRDRPSDDGKHGDAAAEQAGGGATPPRP